MKTAVSKNTSKPPAASRMKSALTNLNDLIQTAPPAEPAAAVPAPKPEKKSRATRPVKAAAASAGAAATSVEAKIDVGFGNSLFIRGQGAGLSWEKGLLMNCRDASTWQWSADHAQGPIEFKLLLNDEVWAQGENQIVPPGAKIEVSPRFEA